MTIQFIGCGKLGKIFLSLFLSSGVQKSDIWVTTGSGDSLKRLQDDYGIHGGYAEKADIVFLGIKPQQLSTIDLTHYRENTLIVSPLAGISVEQIITSASIYRIMPNILLEEKLGTTLIYEKNPSHSEAKTWFENLLSQAGNIVKCSTEDELNHLATISGCGPAYVFAFAQILQELWVQHGGSRETGEATIHNLLLGSAQFSHQKSLSECISTVASKGGITQKALDVFQENGLQETIGKGLDAAYARGQELSQLQ